MRVSRRLAVPVVAAALVVQAGPAWAGALAVPPPVLAGDGPAVGRPGGARLVVQLAHGAGASAVAAAARGLGASVRHELRGLGFVSLEVPEAAAAGLQRALEARPDVASVRRGVTFRPTAEPVNDPSYPDSQKGYLEAIAAPAAWAVSHGSSDVLVAVVDTGVDVGHPDLAGKLAGTFDALTGTSVVTDVVGHGTFVAGVAAAATNNGAGVAGVGFDTRLLAVKTDNAAGSFDDDDIAVGIEWAVSHGADVINLSLGGTETSDVLEAALADAQDAGALVVAAAGNESTSTPSYPAASEGVLAVGATDPLAAGGPTIASFSNHGSWVDVAAPGVGIYSTTSGDSSRGRGYGAGNGTSFSTPIVAGQAALLMAAVPDATAEQVQAAIVGSAHGYSGLGLGTGQVDLAQAYSKMPPATAPAVSQPLEASTVAGSVLLQATSTAPTVRFDVDGAPVSGLVATSGGTATFSWPSWGTGNGQHVVTARDCNANACGGPSSGRTVQLANSAPAIASPAASATVAGDVTVTVTTSDAAPKAQLLVDGAPVGSPAAVSGSSVQLAWPTVGTANGTHALAARSCNAEGVCATTSPPTQVNLQNAAPTITAPLPGKQVGGLVTLAATVPSGALRFRVDGTVVGLDTSSPYEVAVNLSALADGTHTLLVESCSASGATCAGPGTSQALPVKSLHPSLAGAAPTAISPNGDKRADSTTLTYRIGSTQSVSWGVRDATGKVVRGPYSLGTLAAGTRTLVWNGRTSGGSRVPDGTYTPFVSTKAGSLRGYATRAVRVDTVAPALSVSGTVPSFYPVKDGYRDTAPYRSVVNEGGRLTLTVRTTGGKLVRTVVLTHSGAGTFTPSWNGRTASGALLASGGYRVTVTAQDAALNRRSSTAYGVTVSLKKLVAHTGSATVTPSASRFASDVGECSRVTSSPTWAGGLLYESNALGCWDGTEEDISDVVLTYHSYVLPTAVKYKDVWLSITSRSQTGDTALVFYLDTDDGIADGGLYQLPAQYGEYALDVTPLSTLQSGKVLRWGLGTGYGRTYEVRSFAVHFTYYRLE